MSFSSSPSSSQQPSLYQYYSPISSANGNGSTNSDGTPGASASRALRPSTQHNVPPKRTSSQRPRGKDVCPLPAKKQRPLLPESPAPAPPVLRKPTFTQTLVARSLNGQLGQLSELTCLHSARKYFSRPIDAHHVQTSSGHPTFPFAVKCCNTNPLAAVSDENGDVILLDTDISCPTGIASEHVRMRCHDNAIFDVSWSYDDLKLATASGDQTGKVFDIMTRTCVAHFSGYHKTTLKKVAFKPDDKNILTTSSRDGSVYVWDLRCIGIPTPFGPKYKPVQSILNAHSHARWRGSVIASTITGLAWSHDQKIITACDSNSILKVWDQKMVQSKVSVPAEQSKSPISHISRSYGITSIQSHQNLIYALCKDSNLYAYSLGHLSLGPTHTFHHPNLQCSTFWIKLAVQNDLLATGSSHSVVLLLASNPEYWKKGAAVLRGGHSKEVSDVGFVAVRDEVCSIGDDMVVRVWREGGEGETGCGWGWAE